MLVTRTINEVVDDLDGNTLGLAEEVGGSSTVTFGIDGTNYDVDLSRKNANELRALLAPYIKAGRPASRTRLKSVKAKRPRKSGPSSHAIRTWAIENGMEVSKNGPLPKSVKDAYNNAQNAPKHAAEVEEAKEPEKEPEPISA